MNNVKLSRLQKFILMETYKHGEIQNADILIRWYGFQPVSHGKIKFTRAQIGIKRYLSATVSTAKTLTRLKNRRLLRRLNIGYGHTLTPVGRAVVQQLGNNKFPPKIREKQTVNLFTR